jgi:hypothetical protein
LGQSDFAKGQQATRNKEESSKVVWPIGRPLDRLLVRSFPPSKQLLWLGGRMTVPIDDRRIEMESRRKKRGQEARQMPDAMRCESPVSGQS